MNKIYDSIDGLIRTHHCSELSIDDLGQEVILCGWLNKNRNLGGLHFLDLRDKYGITQLNITNYKAVADEIDQCSNESVILAKGKVVPRPNEAKNTQMPTGEIECD